MLAGEFHEITDEAGLIDFAQRRLEIGGVVNLARDLPTRVGESARERLLKAADHFRQVWNPKSATTQLGDRVRSYLNEAKDAAATLDALRAEIVRTPVARLPEIPANQRSIPDRLEAALLFKFFPR